MSGAGQHRTVSSRRAGEGQRCSSRYARRYSHPALSLRVTGSSQTPPDHSGQIHRDDRRRSQPCQP
eukprot:5403620-Amphidinium_carterae.1